MLFALGPLREAKGLTQAAVAEAMGVSRPRVAKLEADSLEDADPQLTTLMRYVAALGGELEVRARLGDRSYRLAGPAQKLPSPRPLEAESVGSGDTTLESVHSDDDHDADIDAILTSDGYDHERDRPR